MRSGLRYRQRAPAVRPAGAVGADRRRRLPLRRARTRPAGGGQKLRDSLPSVHTAILSGRSARPPPAPALGRSAFDQIVGEPQPPEFTRRRRSISRCGSCTRPAPPARRRASSSATAGSSWSISSLLGLGMDLRAGGPLLLLQLDQLDGLELPGRRIPARQRRSCSTTAVPPTRTRWAAGASLRRRGPPPSGWVPRTRAPVRRRTASAPGTGSPSAAHGHPDRLAAAAGGWHWLHRELDDGVRIDPIAGGTDVCTAFVGGSPLCPCTPARFPVAGSGSHWTCSTPRVIRSADRSERWW